MVQKVLFIITVSDSVSRRRRLTESDTVKVPAFKVKVADTIGAGDAFTAGLIYKLIKQGKTKFLADMKSNMIFASAVSAIICTKKGSYEALKNLKQVQSFLATFNILQANERAV